MKSTGIVRKVDQLGRIVIPSEIRANLGINDDSLEIFINEDQIILQKYRPSDIFTGEFGDLIEYKGKKVSKNTIRELCRIANIPLKEDAIEESVSAIGRLESEYEI